MPARRKSRALFSTGSNAVRSGNFDYAIDCYLKCARLVPDHLTYRQALRAAEEKKYNNSGKGATGAALRAGPAWAKLKIAKTRRRWHDVIDHAEGALTLNPWDVDALVEIGVACKELEDMTRTGLWVMQTAAKATKERVDVYSFRAFLRNAQDVQRGTMP